MAAAVAPTGPSALAFFTSWSNYWQETFGRAVVQVFEHWCAAPRLPSLVAPGVLRLPHDHIAVAHYGYIPRRSRPLQLAV